MQDLVFFYSPGACSLAIHAALEHSGAAYEPVRVDLRQKQQLAPDYLRLNPQGRVPTLVVGGRALTEAVAIADYLDQRFPQAGLLPRDGLDRALAMSAIQRLSSDIHPLYRALWIPSWFSDDATAHDVLKTTATRRLHEFHAELEQRLADGRWGPGEPTGFLAYYTAVFLRWSAAVSAQGLGPGCEALRARMANDPAMAIALAREGVTLDSLKRAGD
jgi:glutathione S-transferase